MVCVEGGKYSYLDKQSKFFGVIRQGGRGGVLRWVIGRVSVVGSIGRNHPGGAEGVASVTLYMKDLHCTYLFGFSVQGLTRSKIHT